MSYAYNSKSLHATNKLYRLLQIEALNMDEFMEMQEFDVALPGICNSPGCDYSAEVEPNCTDGWCEDCKKQTVMSGKILLAVI